MKTIIKHLTISRARLLPAQAAEPQCQQSSPCAELTSEFPLRQPSLLLLLGWPQVLLVRLTPEVSRLVVLSPLLHSPLEPALLTQFAGAGVSLATSGPIPRSADCANVLSNVYKFFLQLPPGLTFRDCASLRHLRVPVKLGWPRPGPPSGRGGG